jgi:hypothetical protein
VLSVIGMGPIPPNKPGKTDAKRRINRLLLRCHVILTAALGDYRHALETANEAYTLAESLRLYKYSAKSQWFRGECLYGMKKWRRAHDAYVRSARMPHEPGELERRLRDCSEMMEKESRKRDRATSKHRDLTA